MKTIKKIISYKSVLLMACVIFGLLSINAQSLTYSQERKVRLKVVELMEEYERCSAMDQDFIDLGASFKGLFVSGDAQIYNDLNFLVENEYLSVNDYVTALTQKSSTTRVTVKNIKCLDVNDNAGTIKVKCTFDKYVNLTSDCGIEFSSEFFNKSDYHLSADIIYDSSADVCLFENINGDVERKIVLPQDYRILVLKKDVEYNVLSEGKPLVRNAMNQSFVASNAPIKCKDPDMLIKLKRNEEKCNIWSIDIVPKRLRLMPHYDIGIGEGLKIDDGSILSSKYSKTNNIGLDFGYIFPSKSKLKVGLFTGVGMDNTSIDMSYINNDYSYLTNNDVDNDEYYRHYKDMYLSQSYDINNLTVPIYFDFDIRFGSVVSMYFDLGAQANLNMNSKVKSTKASAYIYGIYPKYGNLMLDEKWGFNGFGDLQYSESMLDSKEISNINKFTADILGKAGFRINIPKTSLALDFGVSYLMGLMDAISIKNSEHRTGEGNACIYNIVNGINSTEHISNLIENMNSVKAQGLKFNIGIVYKF